MDCQAASSKATALRKLDSSSSRATKTSSTSRYFGQPKFFRLPKQAKSTTYYTEYEYFLSFAVAICQGEIREITKVWNGNEIIDISHYKFRLYKGAQDQMPDPYIQAKMNGCVSAFRDLAYIVFEDLPLADFDDVIPNLSFEVTRKANVLSTYTVEDMVKSIVMIPGSGEYVYDTVIQKKQIIAQNGSIKCEKIIKECPDKCQKQNEKGDCECPEGMKFNEETKKCECPEGFIKPTADACNCVKPKPPIKCNSQYKVEGGRGTKQNNFVAKSLKSSFPAGEGNAITISFDFNTVNQPSILQTPLTIKAGWMSVYGLVLQIQDYITAQYNARKAYSLFY